MPIRDLFVFAVVVGLLPMAFRRPYIGLLLFSWLAYMRPQDLCWSFARNMRFSFLVGVTMMVGWLVYESHRRRFTRWDVRTKTMVVLAILVSISFAQAQFKIAYFVRYYFEFLKILTVALFTVGQVDTRERLRWMLWTIAMCFAFYGIKGGLFGVLTGGAMIMRGPGGMLEDNNDFALALVMNLPLLYYLGVNERRIPWVRTGTLVGMGLTMITIVLTHSRGAFLALTGTLLWIAWRSGRLLQACFVLMALSGIFLVAAPQSVLDRLATLADASTESSARARLVSWEIAFNMIEGNPVWGVGLRNFQPRYLDYAEGLVSAETATTYVAHNSYLQIWAESGTPAFICYMILLVSVFVTCRWVYRVGRSRPDMAWAMDYSRMLEATTVGFMVGGTFLNRGHFDLIYHFLALVACLGFVTRWEYLRAAAPARSTARERGVRVRWKPALAGARPMPRWSRLGAQDPG